MESKQFERDEIQEAMDAYQGAEDARYLFVSVDLYQAAIQMCVLGKKTLELCPMVIDGCAGKVWGLSHEADVQTVGELYDAENEAERAERLAKPVVVVVEAAPVKKHREREPGRRWKSMSARAVAVVDEYVEAA